jgi:hypothetical protein|tara:strand:- start:119 stop:313 length:195 start_codon:yes stop_codon:yes gene_type:complete
LKFLVPKIVREWRADFRKGGFKLLLKEKGWKILIAFFIFYLIRDVSLYVIIPYLAVTGFISCPG